MRTRGSGSDAVTEHSGEARLVSRNGRWCAQLIDLTGTPEADFELRCLVEARQAPTSGAQVRCRAVFDAPAGRWRVTDFAPYDGCLIGSLGRDGRLLHWGDWRFKLGLADICPKAFERSGDARWRAMASAVPFEVDLAGSARVDWDGFSRMYPLERPVDSWTALAEQFPESAPIEFEAIIHVRNGHVFAVIPALGSEGEYDLPLSALAQAGVTPTQGGVFRCTVADWPTPRHIDRIVPQSPNEGMFVKLRRSGRDGRWGSKDVNIATDDRCERAHQRWENERWKAIAERLPCRRTERSSPMTVSIRWDALSQAHHFDPPVANWESLAERLGLFQRGAAGVSLESLLLSHRGGSLVRGDLHWPLIDDDACPAEHRRQNIARWRAIAAAVPAEPVPDGRVRVLWTELCRRHAIAPPVGSWRALAAHLDVVNEDPPYDGEQPPAQTGEQPAPPTPTAVPVVTNCQVYQGPALFGPGINGHSFGLVLLDLPERPVASVRIATLWAWRRRPEEGRRCRVRAVCWEGGAWSVVDFPDEGADDAVGAVSPDGRALRWGLLERPLTSGHEVPPELLANPSLAWREALGRVPFLFDRAVRSASVDWPNLLAALRPNELAPDWSVVQKALAGSPALSFPEALQARLAPLRAHVAARAQYAVFVEWLIDQPAADVERASQGELPGFWRDLRDRLQISNDPTAGLVSCVVSGFVATGRLGEPKAQAVARMLAASLSDLPLYNLAMLPLRVLGREAGAPVLSRCHERLLAEGYRLVTSNLQTTQRDPSSAPFFWTWRYARKSEARSAQTVVVLVPHGRAIHSERRKEALRRLFDMLADVRAVLLYYEHLDDLAAFGRLPARVIPVREAYDVSGLRFGTSGELELPLVNSVETFPEDHRGFMKEHDLVVPRSFKAATMLLDYVRDPRGQIAAVYSIRKSGKSTFCFNHLARHAPAGFVYLNISLLASSLYEWLSARYARGVDRERLLVSLMRSVERTLAAQPHAKAQRPLYQQCENVSAPGVALLIDEVDVLARVVLDGCDAQERARRGRLVVGLLAELAGTHPTVLIGLNPWWHQGVLPDDHPVPFAEPLPFVLFSPSELDELCARMLHHQCQVDPSLGAWLHARCGGHPLVARGLMLHITRHALDRGLLTYDSTFTADLADTWERETTAAVVPRALLLGDKLAGFARGLRDHSEPFRKSLARMIESILWWSDDDRGAEQEELRARWESRAGDSEAGFDSTLEAAVQTNFVVARNGRLRLSIPLLHDYLRGEWR